MRSFRNQVVVAALAVVFQACTGGDADPEGDAGGESQPESEDRFPTRPDAGQPTPDAAVAEVDVTFHESDAAILNPERGFYAGLDLLAPQEARVLRDHGHTLAISLVRLDDYRDRPLDSELLDALDEGFAAARASGVKVILRFAYNASFGPDAPKHIILEHIDQLTPVLRDNADVIAVMQAGFIGAWGEWHGSTNDLDNDEDRANILHALLDALPEVRSVQVRAPMYKEGAFSGDAISGEEALASSDRARVGHHNDCFLASDDDLGTYDDPVSEWRAYIADDTRFTPMGGETCRVNEPRTSCAAALEEMEAYHWSYLNRDYKQEVIDGWLSQGCYADIRQRLGHRLTLVQATHSEAVAPGGELDLSVRIENRGFSAPFNARPVYVTITGDDSRRVVRIADADARQFAPGQERSLSTRIQLPADLSSGTYTVSLWLPDPAPSLASDPRYAIRLANKGVWDPDTGDNVLTRELRVDPAAPGPVDPSASELAELTELAGS